MLFFDGIMFKSYLGAWKCDFRSPSGHLGTPWRVRVREADHFLEQKMMISGRKSEKCSKKIENIQKNHQKITKYEILEFAQKCYFSMGLCLNHT